jgi:phosphate transport system permease protein
VGDTLISLMLAGNAPMVPASTLDAIRTLTAHIALVVATDSQSTFYHSVFASGLILFGIMILINLLLRKIGGSFGP